MAGNDQSGEEWAGDYDQTAATLCDAASQLCAAMEKAANLTNTSLSNHQAADGASIYAEHVPGGVLVEDPDPDHYGESIEIGAPSARGGTGGGPSWWHWIAGHTRSMLWPNADIDRLRTIGAAWRTAGRTIQGADTYATSAADALRTQRSPEIAVATKTLGDLGRHCDAIGGAMIDLGNACDDYATMVTEHHHEIEDELKSFIKWTVVIQLAGGVASIFTVGLGEGGAQAGETAMVANAGSKAADILTDLLNVVSRSTVVSDIAERAKGVVPALTRLLKAGEETADLETASLEADDVAADIDDPATFDPESLRGADPANVDMALKDWDSHPAKNGSGTVYVDPNNPGRQIRVMRGYPGNRPDPVTHGPYAVVSQNGVKTKVPLKGNPSL